MIVTTVLAITVPVALGGSQNIDERTKEVTFEVPNHPTLGYVIVVLRFVCMMGFYGGVIGVIYSIFTFEAPDGPDATLPVSPTVQCVVFLTVQFFFVYFVMTAMLTVSEVTGGAYPMETYTLFT